MTEATLAGARDGNAHFEPFRIDFPETELEDLRSRLEHTRWPDELPGTGWDYGVPLDYVRELVDYWRTGYNWREQEARLNAFEQQRTTIDGQRLHFLHVRSPEASALPLVMIHGWPGSVAEFMDVIGPLTDPAAHGGDPSDAFHLVVPALPGFGFSGPTTDRGWNGSRTAAAFAELMRRLGYDRYGAQGGDLGALVAPELGHIDADHVTGIHLNAATVGFIPFGEIDASELATLTDVERQRLERVTRFLSPAGSAYFQVHANRPQMIGYALTDSPVGQLTWALDRMADWTHGPIAEALTREQILTNVMLYWTTRTATSAARMYYENMHGPAAWGRKPSPTPVGVAAFAEDVAIRRYGERSNNITHWTDFDRGGHFAAMEAPDLFVGDIRAFFRALR
jgi:pimeloyl-ACP methyl ester carboxylesterase